MLAVAMDVSAQRKRKKPAAPAPQDELAKLREAVRQRHERIQVEFGKAVAIYMKAP